MKLPTMNRSSRAQSPPFNAIRWIVALALVAGISGACDVHDPVGLSEIASITVSPNPTLTINATQQFTAIALDADGREVDFSPVWTVEVGGGTINPTTGMFTAGTTLGVFTATIRATDNGRSGSATVTVIAGAAVSLTVTPNPHSMAINGTQQFTATAADAGGNPVSITPSWTVVNGGGSINPGTGMFTAGTVSGTFANTIRATSGSLSGTATVTVTAGPAVSITVLPNPQTLPINGVQQFTATAVDASGNSVPITPTWSVVAGGGTINASNGTFTAGLATGTFTNTVRATSGSLSGFATVNVVAGPAVAITVTPNPRSLPIGGVQQFTATAVDAGGNSVPITPVWSVVNGGGVITASTGIFTAGTTTGTFANTVRATSGGLSGFATVTVTTGTVATITVTPNPHSMPINGTQQFTATAVDAQGNPVAITPTWSVENGGGTVNSITGVFTAGTAAGTFNNTVRATSGAVFGSATVTVTPGPATTITVLPNPATMAINGTQQFTATAVDAGGNPVAITPVWSVVAGGGTINAATGMFTAGTTAGTFNNTVRATSGAVFGSATVTVTPGPATTITVLPNPASMAINGTQQFTATAVDAGGNPVAITPAWSVVAGGGTIVAGTGMFTAGTTAGTFNNTVRATSGAVFGSATVTVTPGPATTITVLPNPASMAVNGNQQFTATAVDAGGNPVAITPVWSVVGGGGTINAGTGMFTAGTTAGTFNNTVRATSGALSGSATVTVTAGPLVTIRVLPNPATMGVTQTQQFTASGRDANNNPVVIAAPVWAVVNGGGTINAGTGLFTAGAAAGTFNNTVRATSGGIDGFADVVVTAVPPPVGPHPLLSAENFGILAGAGIDCAVSGSVTGGAVTVSDIGSSPTLTITGFPIPCTFAGSIPAPGVVATAKGHLTAAYLAAQGQVCDLNLSGVDLGFYHAGNPLPPGTYCFSSSAAVTGTLQLHGSAASTWTFQIGSTLTANVGSQVLLSGGAIPDNVYWAVGSSATLGTNSAFQGTIMAFSSITLNGNATLLGRALAQNGAVAMIVGGASIVKP